MKKIRLIVAVFVIGLLVAKNCTVVLASETRMMVSSQGLEVRELSQSELEELSKELFVEKKGNDEGLSLAANTSYTAYEYSEIFDFRIDGTWVASADARCIVWHYTDGKVHLYRRTITMTRLASFDADRTYGRIVNTDGSLSYTEGDRVTIIDYDAFWDFAIDFRVTPTEALFNCYEV